MTVLYVDNEHDSVINDPCYGAEHRSRLKTALSCISAAAEEDCTILHFADVSPQVLRDLAPTAVVLSGSRSDWGAYDFMKMHGLFEFIRAAPTPVLGICAGHQLIGYAHGAEWGPLGTLCEGESDPDPQFAPGFRKERGYLPVQVDSDCPLFRGLGDAPTFFQSHYWQLLNVPAGFTMRASSAWSRIQTIERVDKPVFGVQFHAERYDEAHPDGGILLRNFFALVRES